MKQEIREFEERFDKTLKEVLVLTRGNPSASKGGKSKMWSAHAAILGVIDCETQELLEHPKSLSWLMTEEERSNRKKIFDLKGETIYRLQVRESLPRLNPFSGKMIEQGEQLMVCKVLKRRCHDARLEEILAEYRKPVTIHPEGCEELLLDKALGLYEGAGTWNGCKCHLSLETDKDDVQTAENALAAWKDLLANAADWDKKARVYAAQELTGSANDWLCDSLEEDEAFEEITEERFAERISLSDIGISSDGSFEIFYNDDDMFWGHVVIVSGSLSDGLDSAYIAG